MSKYIKLEDAIGACREKQIIEGDAVTGIRYPTPNEIINDLFDLPTIEVSEDCISRADLLKTIDDKVSQQYTDTYDTFGLGLWSLFVRIVKDAPSVVPSRVEGEWIMHVDDLFPCESTQECSVCHSQHLICGNDDNYCPYCGAYMKG